MIFWCKKCGIPVAGQKYCPLCSSETVRISSNGICNPVFSQEKKLLSIIWGEETIKKNIWYLGGGQYLVDGKRERLSFVEFYKNKLHEKYADELRNNIDLSDIIHNREEYLSANQIHLNELIFEAENYITQQTSKNATDGFVPTVSFSGGKDSTVVSRLVKDALQDEKVIHYFGDTSLEFPATYNYTLTEYRMENPFTPMLRSQTDNDFFKLVNVFGPPSRFERWCCTIFKTGNINNEYQSLAGKSLTFLGIRRSESRERAKYERTQINSKIATQINAMPIINWSDFDVWLYLLYKGVKFNNAYLYGYKRVGCWCCPNNSNWSALLTEIYYPQHSKKWNEIIYSFATKTNKTDIEDYIDNQRWKARKGASGLETKNVNIPVTPCNLSDRARNIVTTKAITDGIIEFFKPFGYLDIQPKTDEIQVDVYARVINEHGKADKGAKIFRLIMINGTKVIKVLPEKTIDIALLINRIKCQVRKYQYCIKCSACDSICPYGAIDTINSIYTIDESKCHSCMKCIAKFYNGCITCQVLAGKKNETTEVDDD